MYSIACSKDSPKSIATFKQEYQKVDGKDFIAYPKFPPSLRETISFGRYSDSIYNSYTLEEKRCKVLLKWKSEAQSKEKKFRERCAEIGVSPKKIKRYNIITINISKFSKELTKRHILYTIHSAVNWLFSSDLVGSKCTCKRDGQWPGSVSYEKQNISDRYGTYY